MTDSPCLPLPADDVNPARAAGLVDRGEIAVGKRADLISVVHPGEHAAISGTWVASRRVFATYYNA